MLKLKRGIGVLVIAAAALTGSALPASASSTGEVTASGWPWVGWYETKAECEAAGQSYADGSTGYWCGVSWNYYGWDLYVGP